MLGTATKVGRPMITKYHLTNTVGYANGLVAICNYTDKYIALWNPSIQKLKKIPFTTHEPHAHPPSPDFRMIHNYGFGYDSTNDDYKLVAIVHFGDGEDVTLSFQVSVYSLKANSWKTIQNMPCGGFSLYSDYLMFSNGALSWLMSKLDGEDQYKILTLDLASEKYREFPIPDPVDGGDIEDYTPDLGVLGDYLCICLTLYDYRRDVWIMKGNGVTESWSLLCSIYLLGKPLLFSENGEMVLLMMERKGYNRLYWYHLEKKNFKKACRLRRRPLTATICRESLCLLLDDDPIKSSKKRKFSNE
ncbi:hypothetical protein CerSpe_002650 [Prunus speciosa]